MVQKNQNLQEKYNAEHPELKFRPKYIISEEGDLLSKIAGSDLLDEKEPQKKVQPFSVIFMRILMRFMLRVDSIKRKYKPFFICFNILWGCVLTLIYFGGIAMALLLLYGYMYMPQVAIDRLEQYGVNAETISIKEHNLSTIILENVEDVNKNFLINTVTIRSTFEGFLQKKVTSVVLDGVTVQIKDKNGKIDMSNLVNLLIDLKSLKDINITSVAVQNASLQLEGQNYNLPIEFSMLGYYERGEKISIPLQLKKENITVSATLSITGEKNTQTWELLNLNGVISLFGEREENLSGSLKLNTVGTRLSSISGKIVLSYRNDFKEFSLDLTRTKDLFKGPFSLVMSRREATDKKIPYVDFSIIFGGLDIKTFSVWSSVDPIELKINKLKLGQMDVENLSVVLNGHGDCDRFNCYYHLTKDANVSLDSFSYMGALETFKSNSKVRFGLVPQKDFFKLSNEMFSFDLNMNNFLFSGIKTITDDNIHISSKSMNLHLGYPVQKTLNSLSASGVVFKNSSYDVQNASLFFENLSDVYNNFMFDTDYMHLLHSDIIKLPFGIKMDSKNGDVSAQISLKNGLLKSKFDGTVDYKAGTFAGTFYIPSVDLQKLGDLTEISSLFPSFVSDVTGEFAMYGNLLWKSENQIYGPFYLSFKDLGFRLNEIDVQNFNAVLNVSSLVPFITQKEQDVFVGSLSHPLPLQNTKAKISFDDQLMRIVSLETSLGGLPLFVENTVLPFMMSEVLVHLKNNRFDLSKYSFLNVDHLRVRGLGSANFPVEIRGGNVSLKNADLRVWDAEFFRQDKLLWRDMFKGHDYYSVKSGNVVLNSSNDGQISAYVVLDGRFIDTNEKSNYRTSMRFNIDDVIRKVPLSPVPTSILELQDKVR